MFSIRFLARRRMTAHDATAWRRVARGLPALLPLVIVGLAVSGCGRDRSARSVDSDSGRAESTARPAHDRMLAVLEQYRTATADTDPFLGRRPLELAQRRLAELGLPAGVAHRQRVEAVLAVAEQELRLGMVEQAIEHLAEVRQTLPKIVDRMPPQRWEEAMFQIGVGYLRLAETENCVHCQTGESCVLPIRGGGIHGHQTGSSEAAAVLAELLARNPDHLAARWLLNIARMTLGEYPEGVPEEYRIDPSKFAGAPFPRFDNVASELSLATRSLSGGVIADDFTGNGAIDLVVSNWDTSGQLRFFVNDGLGKFTDRTEESGLIGIFGGLNLVQADYDNDGHLDVLVLRGAWKGPLGKQVNSLLRNEGGGRFTDVTFDVGLADVGYPTQTAAWYDFNNDGHLDLYIGNEDYPSQLFLNDGNGRFHDIAATAGVTNDRYAKAVTWGDFDQDGHVDLYVSNYGAANRLYRNNGNGTFTDVAAELDVTGPENSFAAWFWDFNNDGLLDLFVGSYNMSIEDVAAQYFDRPVAGQRDRLYQGLPDGGFRDVAVELGVTTISDPMGANFGDLDLDGYLDFYLGTGYPAYESLMPNVMYQNVGGERFRDVTMAGGFGHLQKGHGVAFADFRGVGETDVFIELGGAYPGDAFTDGYFLNPGFGNRSIRIRLQGTHSNRSAIGAKIRLDFHEQGESRSVYRWVNSGGSFGANPLIAHLGVGQAELIDRIEITWPATGATTELTAVEANGQLLEIEEPR